MHNKKTFAVGLVTGLALAGTTAAAADLLHSWTRLDVDAANLVVRPRSGLGFSASPPDPCRSGSCAAQTLTVSAEPIAGLTQVLAVSQPSDPTSPPDPCFTATLGDTAATAGVTLQILHPEQLSLVGADGGALQCSPVTIGVTGPE